MGGRLSNFEKWQAEKRAELTETIDSFEDLLKIMLDSLKRPKKDRIINPTQKEFIEDKSKIKVYMGPGGSGKTIIGVADIILKAMLIPGSKWFIARRDYNDLLDTTARTAAEIMTRLPDGILLDKKKAPPMQWWIKPIITQDNPMPDPSSITFIGLSDYLGSYEYCGGFVDELDEVDEKFFFQLCRAIRYIPTGDPTMELFPISGSFNPPPKVHWLYKHCMGVMHDGTVYNNGIPTISLHTPKYKENARNLRKDYYEDMDVMPEDLRQRYQKGEWVDIYPGDPVIRQFNPKLHINPEIKDARNTLFRFWDFGYNRPACVFAQLRSDGLMQVLKEYMGKQVEGGQFIEIVNNITGQHFPDAKRIQDYGDPAVAQHKDTGSMLNLLREKGINMLYRKVPFDVSLALLRQRFTTLIEGEPALQIHPDCSVIIAALKGGYRLKEDGVTPEKDGYYDHLIDALRYGVYNIYGNGLVRIATASDAAAYTNARTVWQNKYKQ